MNTTSFEDQVNKTFEAQDKESPENISVEKFSCEQPPFYLVPVKAPEHLANDTIGLDGYMIACDELNRDIIYRTVLDDKIAHTFAFEKVVGYQNGLSLMYDSYKSVEDIITNLRSLHDVDLPFYMSRVAVVACPGWFPTHTPIPTSGITGLSYPKYLQRGYSGYNSKNNILCLGRHHIGARFEDTQWELLDNDLKRMENCYPDVYIMPVPFIQTKFLQKANFDLYGEQIMKVIDKLGSICVLSTYRPYDIDLKPLPLKYSLHKDDLFGTFPLLRRKRMRKTPVKTTSAAERKARADKRAEAKFLKESAMGLIPLKLFKDFDSYLSRVMRTVVNDSSTGSLQYNSFHAFRNDYKGSVAYNCKGTHAKIAFYYKMDRRFNTFYNRKGLTPDIWRNIFYRVRKDKRYYELLYEFKPYLLGWYRFINSPVFEEQWNTYINTDVVYRAVTLVDKRKQLCELIALMSKEIRTLHLLGDPKDDHRTEQPIGREHAKFRSVGLIRRY